MNTNTNKVGLVLSLLIGGWHVVWSGLVFLGWGQPLIDFVLWAHMIHVPYVVGPFDIIASATLVAFTAVFGYVIGCVVAMLWNKIHPVV